MTDTASRARPSKGTWRTAVVPVPSDLTASMDWHLLSSPADAHVSTSHASSVPARLEFMVTDGLGNEDKPQDAATYVCASPGSFKLEAGRLLPFPTARKPPSMLVRTPPPLPPSKSSIDRSSFSAPICVDHLHRVHPIQHTHYALCLKLCRACNTVLLHRQPLTPYAAPE